jgi:hypothetical protein
MRMKRLLVCTVLALGGCQSTTDEPNQTTVLAGDYRAVSECFYRNVATTPGYKKSDAPSIGTTTIEGSMDGGSTDKIDFIATGEGITKVQAQLGTPGADKAWARYLSVLRECDEPSAGAL